MSEIWLIRHGESAANAGLPTADPSAIPLTPRGERQAALVAGLFPQAPALIVSSPYLRARQTAAPTAARFPAAPQAEWPIQEFTYLGLPDDRATTAAERRPLVDAFWERCDPEHCAGGGSESFAALLGRVRSLLERLADPPAGLLALFSHGLFIRVLLWELLARPGDITPQAMRRCRMFVDSFAMPNGALIKLRPSADGWTISPIITTHLD